MKLIFRTLEDTDWFVFAQTKKGNLIYLPEPLTSVLVIALSVIGIAVMWHTEGKGSKFWLLPLVLCFFIDSRMKKSWQPPGWKEPR